MNKNEWKKYAKTCADGLYEADNTEDRKRYYRALCRAIKDAPFLSEYYAINDSARLYVDKVFKKEAVHIVGNIIYEKGVMAFDNGIQQCYLIEMYDRDDNFMYSKVGTTTRTTGKRMIEHLDYYQKENIGKIRVLRVYDCGNIDAEGYESLIRALYILNHPGTFKKNDRFINIHFDVNDVDRIVKKIVDNELYL